MAAALAASAPGKLLACATCFSANVDDRMTSGVNWAILTLGVVVTTVLGAFLTFFIHLMRKSEAVEAARTKSAAAPAPEAIKFTAAPAGPKPELKTETPRFA